MHPHWNTTSCLFSTSLNQPHVHTSEVKSYSKWLFICVQNMWTTLNQIWRGGIKNDCKFQHYGHLQKTFTININNRNSQRMILQPIYWSVLLNLWQSRHQNTTRVFYFVHHGRDKKHRDNICELKRSNQYMEKDWLLIGHDMFNFMHAFMRKKLFLTDISPLWTQVF